MPSSSCRESFAFPDDGFNFLGCLILILISFFYYCQENESGHVEFGVSSAVNHDN
jgi:hypothetical protein